MVSVEDVIERLKWLGYEAVDEDEAQIEYAIESAELYIKNYCNICEITDEIYWVEVDIAAGRFLRERLAAGDDVCSSIDLSSQDVKSISEGDVSVTYKDSSSQTEMYSEYIEGLCDKDDVLAPYKRLRW